MQSILLIRLVLVCGVVKGVSEDSFENRSSGVAKICGKWQIRASSVLIYLLPELKILAQQFENPPPFWDRNRFSKKLDFRPNFAYNSRVNEVLRRQKKALASKWWQIWPLSRVRDLLLQRERSVRGYWKPLFPPSPLAAISLQRERSVRGYWKSQGEREWKQKRSVTEGTIRKRILEAWN